MALIATIAVAPANAADPNARVDAVVDVQADAGAADTLAEAAKIAVSFDHPVQVTGLDDATSTTYANPDGTQTVDVSSVPLRLRRDNGWVPVDLTLRQLADGSIAPAASPVDVVIGGTGSTTLAQLTVGESAVAYGWDEPLPAPKLDGATATYADVLPGVDAVVSVTVTGAETSLVYRDAKAVADWRSVSLPLRLTGVSAAPGDGGAVSFLDADGARLMHSSVPRAWDARGGGSPKEVGDGPVVIADATLAEAPAAKGMQVAESVVELDQMVSVPSALADDPAVEYPIVVDPAIDCDNCTKTISGYIEDDGYDEINSSFDSGRVHAGTFDSGTTRTRGLYMFQQGTSHGAKISAATLKLSNVYSWSCTAASLTIYRAGAFTSSVTWANQPSVDTDPVVTLSYAHGYSSSCPSATVNYDVTALADVAANSSSYTTYNFELRAGSETSSTYWKKFSSGATLSVTYDHRPDVPTGVGFHTARPSTPGCVRGSGRPTVDWYPGWAWHAKVVDDDGGTLQAQFQWWDLTTPATIYTVGGTTVASGAYSIYTVGGSSGSFVDGHNYGFRARGFDATLHSDWTSADTVTTCEFHVSDPAPTTPTSVGFNSATHGTPGCVTGSSRPIIDRNYAMVWQAKVTDPDGRSVKGQFEWWDLATSGTKSTMTSASVASGTTATVSIAALSSSFVDGHSYAFHARAYNNAKYSAWTSGTSTATCEFTVTDPPPAVTAGSLAFATPAKVCGSELPTNSPFTLKATVTDPDIGVGGRAVRAEFTVKVGSTVVWGTWASAYGGNRVVTSAAIPANLIADHTAFTWTVRAYNAHKYSSLLSCSATSNNNIPSPPVVTGTGVFGTDGVAQGHVGDTDTVTVASPATADTPASKFVVLLTDAASAPASLPPAASTCTTPTELVYGVPQTVCATSGHASFAVRAMTLEFTVTAQAYSSVGNASPSLGSDEFEVIPTAIAHDWVMSTVDLTVGASSVEDVYGGAPLALSESGATWVSPQYPGQDEDPNAPATGPTTWLTALHLDGTGSATTGSGASPLTVDATNAFAVSVWVRPEVASSSAEDVALSLDGTSLSGFKLGQYNGKWMFCMPRNQTPATPYDGDCAYVNQPTTTSDYVGQWTLLVGTWDPIAHQIRLSVNGTAAEAGVAHTSTGTASGALRVGAVQDGTVSTSWIGDVLNPAIFAGMLAPEQLTTLNLCGLENDNAAACPS